MCDGGGGDSVLEVVCVCMWVCVYSRVSKMRQYVLLCLKDTIRVRLRGARSPPPNYLLLGLQVLQSGYWFSGPNPGTPRHR